ncbi:Major facilitator superfamily [Xenorhabdus poinarii G6]|uniref:Major facilitator superfamily n=1 Tax=Xenorhabdus poinarii G6 TaxID=1354304 RepID=A0A068R529_9GAMM|nr:MFS transporter [Xenorhabdus poinarii]CDG22372.1 Major facilitator superfamily [Xenorhabdus poinarii G6]
MPLVIYMFTICSFAIGFTEFVTIGLVSAIADDLHLNITSVGLSVTAYALGVVIGAPILTALANKWNRKKLLITAMSTFIIANLIAGMSYNLTMLLFGRLLSGLAHGVFIAVAAGVATRLVPENKSGAAISLVFGGATVAMAFGVPLGTWMGSVFHWQIIFLMLSIFGFIGTIGLLKLMPHEGNKSDKEPGGISKNLAVILNPRLLGAALIPMVSYTGSFTLYTYISPVLRDMTHLEVTMASLLLFTFGIGAAIGNYVGGVLTDKLGNDKASLTMLIGIGVTLLLTWFGSSDVIMISILITLLGLTTFGAISPLQSRIIDLAKKHSPDSVDTASGMNIAAFNAGVVCGSLLGGVAINTIGLTSLSWVGSVITVIAIAILLVQMNMDTMRSVSKSNGPVLSSGADGE